MSIFILKSQLSSLGQAETFLRNRNWKVESSSNLRETLAYVIEKKPQYVLITSDHPNPKVKGLPTLFIQALPVRVIGFSEKGSGASIRDLLALRLEYNLYPPVSGPAIERMILKIRKDEENRSREQEKQNALLAKGDRSSDSISFKGELLSEAELNQRFEQAKVALGKMAGPSTADSSEKSSSHAYTPDGFGSSNPNQPAYRPQPASLEGNQNFTKNRPAYVPDDVTSDLPSILHQDVAPTFENQEYEKKQTPVMESEYIGRRGPKNYTMTRTESENGAFSDSVILRGSQTALEETVNLKNIEKVCKVSNTTHVACILIRSLRFSGYLVCALGENRKLDKSFLDLIQKRLFLFLRANGEKVKEEDNLTCQIQEVEFADWALEEAEFLRKSVHDGDEIVMAYFPTIELRTELEDSASEKMVQLNISDLKDDIPVEFDLYIFMPQNNKYLLYTPKGKPLYGPQKSRLREKGITHMHLRREASASVQQYNAQNYLNEKITSFKSNGKIKKT